MATAIRSIGTAVPASPALRAPINDNISLRPWADDPRAKRVLASCIANPPSGEWKRQTYGFSTDRWWSYVGFRAEVLDAVRLEVGTRLMLAHQEHGEPARAAFDAWCREPGVTEVIDAALDAAFGQEG